MVVMVVMVVLVVLLFHAFYVPLCLLGPFISFTFFLFAFQQRSPAATVRTSPSVDASSRSTAVNQSRSTTNSSQYSSEVPKVTKTSTLKVRRRRAKRESWDME